MGSSVSAVTKLWAKQPHNQGSIPGRGRELSSLLHSGHLWDTPRLPNGYNDLPELIKGVGA
jgi:hypothetical protein